jgi:hypothetical protein
MVLWLCIGWLDTEHRSYEARGAIERPRSTTIRQIASYRARDQQVDFSLLCEVNSIRDATLVSIDISRAVVVAE